MKRQQVERERHQPQQRHRGDVLREVVGDREQQHRAGRRQREPEHVRRFAAADAVVAAVAASHRLAAACARPARAKQRESGEQPRPHAHLLRAAEERLDQERIADQREQRGEVRQREQAVGVSPGRARANQACSSGLVEASRKYGRPTRRAEQQQDAR